MKYVDKMDEFRKRLKDINLDKVKKDWQEKKKQEKIDPQQEYERLVKEYERYTRIRRERQNIQEESKTIYIKKTMIFKKDYLDIIDGLASINDMQLKDVLNQLLEKSINMLDENVRDKALKIGKKAKPIKREKSIF